MRIGPHLENHRGHVSLPIVDTVCRHQDALLGVFAALSLSGISPTMGKLFVNSRRAANRFPRRRAPVERDRIIDTREWLQ
jgi:hypothetical protein